MGVLGTAAAVNVVNNSLVGNAAANNRSVAGPEPPCQCTVDNFLAPLKSKMKGLKKIRKKMGLAPKSVGAGAVNPNLPPVRFHNVHGENVRLYKNGFVARRVDSFCKGVAFSSRPVAINERVYLKFLEISDNWSGVIRFGFTTEDPLNIKKVPKYACPDLTSKSGFWAKALSERHAVPDSVLFFYVDAGGDLHYGLNGESKGVFMQGIDTRSPLWVLLDIYGNSTIVEFLDCRPQLNNNNNNRSISSSDESSADIVAQLSAVTIGGGGGGHTVQQPAASLLLLRDHHQQMQQQLCGPADNAEPVSLLRKGKHVMISTKDGVPCVGTRLSTAFFQGYTFTKRPLTVGDRYVVQITKTSQLYVGSLSFGVTCCDPNTVRVGELPDDPNQLVDRPEYWVMSRNVAEDTRPGDLLTFTINDNGQVLCGKNGNPETVLMCVDHSQILWGVFDIYGTTTQIVVSKISSPPPPPPPASSSAPAPPSSSPQAVVVRTSGQPSTSSYATTMAQPTVVRTSNIVEVMDAGCGGVGGGGGGGGTVLIVNLPPAPANHHVCYPSPALSQTPAAVLPYHQQQQQQQAALVGRPSVTVQQIHQPSRHPAEQPPSGGEGECSICFERPVDCALYTCGHLCMCFECAKKQWVRLGRCPICRAVIKDVIKIYK